MVRIRFRIPAFLMKPARTSTKTSLLVTRKVLMKCPASKKYCKGRRSNKTVSILIGTCRLNLNILKTIWLDAENHFNSKINTFFRYLHSCACIFLHFCSNFRFPFEMLQVQDFLLRFDLGPPEGFKDDDEIEAEDDDHFGAGTASVGQPGQHEVEVTLGRVG